MLPRRADPRGAAEVVVPHALLEVGARGHGLAERVQVHGDDVDVPEVVLGHAGDVRVHIAPAQDSARHSGVWRLHHPAAPLRAASCHYHAPGEPAAAEPVGHALILARRGRSDGFNALDLRESGPCFKDLKVGIGDGNLRYYLYNWRLSEQLAPSDIGLVLT